MISGKAFHARPADPALTKENAPSEECPAGLNEIGTPEKNPRSVSFGEMVDLESLTGFRHLSSGAGSGSQQGEARRKLQRRAARSGAMIVRLVTRTRSWGCASG
jgi:hypothetical protein